MGGGWATLAFLVFGFIILAYLLLQIYDRLRQDARAHVPDAPQLRSGVDELVRELRQAADQINADMTVRANTLQRLVDDANEALRRLDAAAQRAAQPPRPGRAAPLRAGGRAAAELPDDGARRPTGSVSRSGGRPCRQRAARARVRAVLLSDAPVRERSPASAGTPRVPPPRPAPVVADGPWPGAPAGAPSVQIPRVAAASPAAASAYRQSAGPDPFVGVDLTDTGRFQAVRRLAEQGMSAGEIARSIGLGREEVELIMRVSGEGAS